MRWRPVRLAGPPRLKALLVCWGLAATGVIAGGAPPASAAEAAALARDAATPARAAGAQGLQWDFGARLHYDYARFEGVYSRDGGRHDTGYLRRASVDAMLSWRQWSAAVELETDSTRKTSVDSAWLRFMFTPPDARDSRAEVRAGRIDPDVGLEQATSSNWLWGIERSAIWDLAPDVADSLEGVGLRADGHGIHWQASAGLYDKRDHSALALRAAWVPLREPRSLLHLGASFAATSSWRDDGRIRSRLAVRGVSEHDAGRRSTLAPAAADAQAFGPDAVWVAELAWRHADWSVQSEVLVRRIEGHGAQPERQARGAYVLIGWALSGDARRYDIRRARIGAPEGASSAWGSLETFYRLDRLEVEGERGATVHTVGLSWQAKRYLRLMLNWHRARSEDANALGQKGGSGMAARVQATL